MRRLVIPLVLSALLIGGVTTAIPAAAATTSTLSVSGAVTTPVTYSMAQLAAMPQVTLPDTRIGGTHSVTGVSLEALVNASVPVVPAAKNSFLRVAVTVDGLGPIDVAVALGEVDPSFGNHPALLALTEDGHSALLAPDLVFPGDNGLARTVLHVTSIKVAVESATVPTPAAGSVVVVNGSRSRALTAAQIGRLPATTRTVSFLSGTASTMATETGPSLNAVLLAAGIFPWFSTSVAAVGNDGYLAAVTPYESVFGGRVLMLSTAENGVALAQPRLVVGGDVKGGRYVSGVVELLVTS
jgi:hypothetical protein